MRNCHAFRESEQNLRQRLAFHLIHMPVDDVKRLASTMVEARENIKYCKECYTLTDQELCPNLQSNSNRDHQTIMVVENTRDLAAYEKTGKYNGVYHVLHGAISPMLGIGPEDIKLKGTDRASAGRCKRSDHCNESRVWKVRLQRCISVS